MKLYPKLLFVLFFHLHLSAYSQEVEEYWENDSLKVKGFMLDGKREGLWEEWYTDGKPKLAGKYKSGILDSVWTFYCLHGIPERQVSWKDHKCYKIITFSPTGIPNHHLDFREGLSVDEYLWYLKLYDWGKKNQLLYLARNKLSFSVRHQELLSYGEDSRTFISSFYIGESFYYSSIDSLAIYERLRNQKILSFCKKLKKQFTYNEFVAQGVSKHLIKKSSDEDIFEIKTEFYNIPPYGTYLKKYYINDTLIARTEFLKNGEDVEFCKEYYPDFKIRSSGRTKDGLMEGNWKYFTIKGKSSLKEFYIHDELISSKKGNKK